MLVFALGVALGFAVGTYRLSLQREAVSIALVTFSKAKAVLGNVILRARAEAKAEAERLEALAAKYL